MHQPAPPPYRRRRKNGIGCTCDCNYARSIQGILKVIQLFILGLAWILIGTSPYWRPIFVIGGETWPFHMVMLFSIVAWLSTLCLYSMFLSGFHLNMPHKNWPRIELIFNIVMTVFVLIGACLESANVWRWDMSRGIRQGGGSSSSSYYQYGLRPGMSFTQTLNFNTYCATRPHDCTDFFNLLAGNNTYYTNHLFAVVLLFFALIAYLVSVYFAYRTYKVFQRDMYQPGKMPKPTLWMRLQYQVETTAEKARKKMTKLVHRNDDEDSDEEAGDEVDTSEKVHTIKVDEKDDVDLESGFSPGRSSRSEGRQSRPKSRSSHSHTHRSRSEKGSSSRLYTHDEDEKSTRSSSNGRSKHHSTHGSHSSHHASPRDSHKNGKPVSPPDYKPPAEDYKIESVPVLQAAPSKKKSSKKEKKKEEYPEVDLSPVASVMI